jgi:hypothetical protein
MTRTIFLITSIAVTALAVAVPSALAGAPPSAFEHGKGGTLSSPQGLDAVTYFYANERATIPFPATIHDHGDASQAKLVAQTPVPEILRDHGDATQAKIVAESIALEVVRDHGDATQARLDRLSGPVGRTAPLVVRDHGSAEQAKLDAQSSGGTTSVVESSPGSELDWSQLGIGFGVGMLLVLGLVVGVQFARNERLAH